MSTSTVASEKERGKQVIGEIIRQMGGRLTSKAAIVQAYYQAHLAYAESQAGYLSLWPLVKQPTGPSIKNLDNLLGEMVAEGMLRIDDTSTNGASAMQLELNELRPDDRLGAEAQEAIRVATATTESLPDIRDFRTLRSWNTAAIGDEMNIYLDSIPDAEFATRQDRLQSMSATLKSLWQ